MKITRKSTITINTGMICDRCGFRDDQYANNFSINHPIGYGSLLDMHQVNADLCDNCLLTIVLENIPNAKIITPDGRSLTREETRARLQEKSG